MIIDTDKIDRQALARQLLKRGGMDWIDDDPDVLWESKPADQRSDLMRWRESMITEKVAEIDRFLDSCRAVLDGSDESSALPG